LLFKLEVVNLPVSFVQRDVAFVHVFELRNQLTFLGSVWIISQSGKVQLVLRNNVGVLIGAPVPQRVWELEEVRPCLDFCVKCTGLDLR